MDRRLLFVLERLAWLAAVLVSLGFLGVGLEHTFQIELTDDAIREQRVGFQMVRLSSVALLAVVAYGFARGTRTWVCVVVLLVPLLCGGLSEVLPESAFPHLVFLVTAPFAGLAALVGLFLPWRTHVVVPVPAGVGAPT